MSLIEVKGLSKSFGERKVLSDVNLSVQEGEKIVIIGGSGCSKTSVNESTGTRKAGTLSLLNSSEEDYARVQNRSLNRIIGTEEGIDPEAVDESDFFQRFL